MPDLMTDMMPEGFHDTVAPAQPPQEALDSLAPDVSDLMPKDTSTQGAAEAAAARTRQSVRPEGGRQEGAITKGLEVLGSIPGHMVEDAVNSTNTLGHIAQSYSGTGQLDPSQAGEFFKFAVNRAANGTALPEKGAAGIFGGRLSMSANHAKMFEAENMQAAGATREEIWAKTGWYNQDGHWKFEIDDSGTVAARPSVWSPIKPMEDTLAHSELYGDHYPEVGRIKTGSVSDPVRSGAYFPPGDRHLEAINLRGQSAEDIRSTALHEIQHAIQNKEGFPNGTNPEHEAKQFTDLIEKTYTKIQDLNDVLRRTPKESQAWKEAKDTQTDLLTKVESIRTKMGGALDVDKIGRELYMANRGEMEARNVQFRRDFTPAERRRVPPWVTEGKTSFERELFMKQMRGQLKLPDAQALVAKPSGSGATPADAEAQAAPYEFIAGMAKHGDMNKLLDNSPASKNVIDKRGDGPSPEYMLTPEDKKLNEAYWARAEKLAKSDPTFMQQIKNAVHEMDGHPVPVPKPAPKRKK